MTLNPDIFLVISTAALVGYVLIYRGYRHLRYTLHELERHGISETGGAVPTIVMEQDAPVEVVLPNERRLFISTLTMAQAEKWRKEFLLFMGKNFTALNLIPFLETAGDKQQQALAVLTFSQAFVNKGMRKNVARLLDKTVLRDKRRNPGNVTARWLLKNCTELELAEVLLVTYAYNNGAYIKKNYLSMMEKVAMMYPGMSDISSCSSLRTGTQANGIERRHCLESPFAPERVVNERTMKQEKWQE